MNPTADNIFRLNTKNPEAVISISDELLEVKSGIRCDLFSAVSANEFSLAMLDRKKNTFLALEVFQRDETADSKHADWLKTIPGKSNILKNYEFKSAIVAVVNEQSTLVPSALFRKEDAGKYLEFNLSEETSNIHSETIRSYEMVNVFSVPASMNESLNHLFDNPVIHHHSTALLEGIHLSFKRSNEKSVMLNIRSGYVDVVVTEGKKLILVNSFNYKSTDDLVYYVMFVFDRLQLNPEIVSTFLFGKVERESDVYNQLYKYIRNLDISSRPNVFDFSYAFKEIPSQFYFNLFSLALCES